MNGFGGKIGRAGRRASGRGMKMSTVGAYQVGALRSTAPPPLASGLQASTPAPVRSLQPRLQQQPASSKAHMQETPVPGPVSDIAVLENGVARLSTNGRRGSEGPARRAAEVARFKHRTLMDAKLYGDMSNDGYMVSHKLMSCIFLFLWPYLLWPSHFFLLSQNAVYTPQAVTIRCLTNFDYLSSRPLANSFPAN